LREQLFSFGLEDRILRGIWSEFRFNNLYNLCEVIWIIANNYVLNM